MDKSVIDNMNKEEILELLSPYLNAGESGRKYYEMIDTFEPKLELSDPNYLYPEYTQGKITIYLRGGLVFNDNKWTEVGSVGTAIYSEVVSKYRDMIINNIIN